MAQRRGRFYAVIYEGRDPITGKEARRWHPAGTDRAEAERLAARLAAKERVRIGASRSLTFGAYLTSQWLPARKLKYGYAAAAAAALVATAGQVAAADFHVDFPAGEVCEGFALHVAGTGGNQSVRHTNGAIISGEPGAL